MSDARLLCAARREDLTMSTKKMSGCRKPIQLTAGAIVLMLTTGCQTMRDLVAIPFDVAAHVAVETARMPYEAGKIGAQGLVEVIAGALR
jgi:hypothetical protein